jgi:post-segregation antitoxin (ccd killing protein)
LQIVETWAKSISKAQNLHIKRKIKEEQTTHWPKENVQKDK